jgi:hypothetical protein
MKYTLLSILTISAIYGLFSCKTGNLASGAGAAVSKGYNLQLKGMIDEQCATTCHSNEWRAGGIDLSNFAEVKLVAADGRLVSALQHADGFAPMPKNAAQWNAEKVQEVINWINAGMPE